MSESITVRALRVEQGGNIPVFSFFLNGKDILRIAEISRLKRDAEGELLGYQRSGVKQHVNEIAAYLNSEKVIFPNSIILALSSEIKFKQSRGPKVGNEACLSGNLEIPIRSNGDKIAWIVDGQQRTMALDQLEENRELIVPITGFVSDDFEIHRSQFLLVNKVKPLPKGLIHELLPAVNTRLPASLAKNKIPSAVCDILNKDPESPFQNLIIRTTTDKKTNKEAVISDNSMIQLVRSSLNSVHGCLYQYKNVATGEIDVESVRLAVNLFWTEVKGVFPEAWGKPSTKSRLMHGVGIKAMGVLMDRIMSSVHPDAPDARATIREGLERVKPHCAWTQGSWNLLEGLPWNQLQNSPSHVKLLSNMLIRAYTGAQAA